MHELYELKEMLCKELEEYGRKGDLDVGSLEIVDRLAHAVKNIGKIIEMDDGGYSNDGDRYDMRGGSYARGRGRYAKRDTRGRYSSYGYSRAEDDMETVMDDLRSMVSDLPHDKQAEVKRFIDKMDHMK